MSFSQRTNAILGYIKKNILSKMREIVTSLCSTVISNLLILEGGCKFLRGIMKNEDYSGWNYFQKWSKELELSNLEGEDWDVASDFWSLVMCRIARCLQWRI